MNSPAEIADVSTTHGSHSASEDSRSQLALALKFEPSELHEFEMADKAAGQMMGKLLAFLFCVLVFMMAGVNVWMMNNAWHDTETVAPVTVDADHANH